MRKVTKSSQALNMLHSSDFSYLSPTHSKIIEVIDAILTTDFAKNFSRNCIAAADIVQHTLFNVGIKSRIVECTLSVIKTNPDGTLEYGFTGFDEAAYDGQVDTHVVVVTETDPPLLIDLSLGHFLPSDKAFVIYPLKVEKEKRLLLKHEVENLSLSYFEKTTIRLIDLHQKTIIERIQADQKRQNLLDSLKVFVYATVILGITNFTLNIILIILKTLNP